MFDRVLNTPLHCSQNFIIRVLEDFCAKNFYKGILDEALLGKCEYFYSKIDSVTYIFQNLEENSSTYHCLSTAFKCPDTVGIFWHKNISCLQIYQIKFSWIHKKGSVRRIYNTLNLFQTRNFCNKSL